MRMAQTDVICAALIDAAGLLCDDCVAARTGLGSDTIQEICGGLEARKLIRRRFAGCVGCGRFRVSNQMLSPDSVESAPAKPDAAVEVPSAVIPPSSPAMPIAPAGALHLVSCVAAKGPTPAPAKDLYVSPWFVKARAYIESRRAPWRILSAKHGLLDPETVIAPYDETLLAMGAAERRRWADGVLVHLAPLAEQYGTVCMLAGNRYREILMPELRRLFRQVDVPMETLRIGEQMAWLAREANTQCA